MSAPTHIDVEDVNDDLAPEGWDLVVNSHEATASRLFLIGDREVAVAVPVFGVTPVQRVLDAIASALASLEDRS